MSVPQNVSNIPTASESHLQGNIRSVRLHGRRKCTYPTYMNEAWNWSENIGIHAIFFLLTRSWAITDLCHMGGKKIGIGSLEPCSVNAAKHTKTKYRVLPWNSRWHSPIGLTQSDLMTSLSHGTADWFSPESVANELAAQHSNIWLVLTVAVCRVLQKPSTFPSSTCIDLLRGDSCMLYGGYFLYVIWAAAFCVCIGSSKSRYLLCRSSSVSKTKYINIVMYITMPIPPRVVMTEIILMTFCSISSCQTSAFIRQFGRNIILKESKWIIK